MLELLWYEPESKGGASELRLLMLRLVFPSLDTFPPLSQSSAAIVDWVLHSIFVPDEDSDGREV